LPAGSSMTKTTKYFQQQQQHTHTHTNTNTPLPVLFIESISTIKEENRT